MSADTIRTDEKQMDTPSAAVSTTHEGTLASIVAHVKHDSRQAARAYLDETEVKHGGE